MLRRAVCLLVLLMAALSAQAQPAAKETTRQPRILLLVDASSSMLQAWNNNTTRFQTAGNIITALMDSIYTVNAGVEFGLRVYGHQSPAQINDCFDSRQEVMFSKNNITQMSLRLASIRPFGVSPIAYSLQEAATNDLVDEARNAYSIILITDGGESCGGNICDVVKQLIERKIYFKPYIISLVDYKPLRDQYACLGSYLQAAKPEDVPTAIHTIVDAYRPLLSAPILAVKVDSVRKPAIQVIDIPAWIPERGSLQRLTVVVPQRTFQTGTYRPILHTMALPRTIPVSKPPAEPVAPVVIVPELRKQQPLLPGLRTSGYRPVFIAARSSFTPPARRNAAVPLTLPYIQPERENVASINAAAKPTILPTSSTKDPALQRRDPRVALTLPTIPPDAPVVRRDTIVAVKPKVPITIPPASNPPKRDTATKTTVTIKKLPVIKPAPKPVTTSTSTNKPKETPFKKEVEDAKETSLAILFTDGHGKFFSTTPQLQLLDATTGKLVKQFYRTVDESGNPDPQVVPAGTYNLLVVGSTNMLMRRVTVEANKKNKLTVTVGNGSLRFEYYDAPGRPVSEFEALVNIRFEPGPTIRQHCTAELEYPPGSYYIEVNTMPITRYSVPIDFGATSVVYLPEPGYVQFTNSEPKGRVSLFAPLGDKFVRFVDVNVTGNPASQKLMLKPGKYEAHWVKTPNMPYASETVEIFNVQSNSITEVELH